MGGKSKFPADVRLRVAGLYREHTLREVVAMTGISSITVRRWCAALGVRHSPACDERIRAARAERMALNVKLCDKARRAAIWKRRRRMDELRWLGGQPQRTRHRFSAITQAARKAKSNLCQNNGYRCLPGEVTTLLYDRSTRRTPREAKFTERYGLVFKAAEDRQKQDIKI